MFAISVSNEIGGTLAGQVNVFDDMSNRSPTS
ncbi:hypothetical protein J2T56_002282 [Natronobacillus azotifigens]